MGGMIGRFMFVLMFCGLIAMVIGFIISPEIQNSQLTPVIIIFTGLFTIIFGFADLVEETQSKSVVGKGSSQEDLHRAYQAGYDLVERNTQLQLDYQERAYQAQLDRQERQHRTTLAAFVTLSLADKQTIKEALLVGIRLVEANRQLFLRYSDGRMQPVSQLEDMTPDKLRYMAVAQLRLRQLRAGQGEEVVEADYREM